MQIFNDSAHNSVHDYYLANSTKGVSFSFDITRCKLSVMSFIFPECKNL